MCVAIAMQNQQVTCLVGGDFPHHSIIRIAWVFGIRYRRSINDTAMIVAKLLGQSKNVYKVQRLSRPRVW